MAFTERQILLTMEMVDIPAGAVLYRVDNLGLNSTQFAALTSPASAAEVVRSILGGMSAAMELIVQEIVTEYESIRMASCGIMVQSGSVGDLTNTTVDFPARIQQLKALIKVYVPLYQDWTTLQTRNANIQAMSAAVRM